MKTIFDHIAYVQAKPHHIRKKVAFGIAAAASTLIALVWVMGNAATGGFAIQGSNFAMSNGDEGNTIATTSVSDSQNLAGAGAAAALQNTNVPAHIEVVDTMPATKVVKPDPTVLPF